MKQMWREADSGPPTGADVKDELRYIFKPLFFVMLSLIYVIPIPFFLFSFSSFKNFPFTFCFPL
jgi:hypothetical protein